MGDDYPLIEGLSERELEVLKYVASGLSNRQIAAELYLALGTVKTHIHNIYGKLGVSSRTQAIIRANQLNLFEDLDYNLPANFVLNPYKGLRAFEEEDADDFFGRQALVQSILSRLQEDHPLSRFLAVVGPSGSGKSSVVKAGVIPAIRKELNWLITDMMPGPYPFEELAVALNQLADTPNPDLLNHIALDKRGLLRTTRLALPTAEHVLIVIDQFEEVFTLVHDTERARLFLDLLYQAVIDRNSPLHIIVTLRADFYDRPLLYPDFSELIKQRTEVVTPLSASELERAIVGPVEQIGVRPEKGLVAAIVAEINEQPGALPLLQYALTELFDKRRNHHLELSTYRQLGGTLGALARRAEKIYERFSDEAQETTRQLFLRLITLGEGTEDTRRRISLSELYAIDDQILPGVLDAFDESRLLTFDADPLTLQPTVEIAHEAIIREWGRLRGWLDESRADIRRQRLLQHSAEQWLRADQDRSFLLSGTRLEQFEEWVERTTLILTKDEAAFLEASLAERVRQVQLEAVRQAREADLERRSRRVLRALVGVFLMAALIASGMALFAFDERATAQDARDKEAQARATSQSNAEFTQALFLASEAQQALEEGDTDLAIALVMEAYGLAPDASTVKRTLANVASIGGTQSVFTDSDDIIADIALSQDRKLLVTAGFYTGTVSLWDVKSHQKLSEWQIFRQNAANSLFIEQVDISSDNRLIVVGGAFNGSGGQISLINVEDDVIEALPQQSSSVMDVQFSTDGEYLASISLNSVVTLWNVSTGEKLHQVSERILTAEGHLLGHSIAFSPDGKMIAYTLSVNRGNNEQAWSTVVRDVQTFNIIRRDQLETADGPLQVSQDGRYFIFDQFSDDSSRVMRYIDVMTGDTVSEVKYAPELASSGAIDPALRDASDNINLTRNGQEIMLVDMVSGTVLARLRGHRSGVLAGLFLDPDHVMSTGGGLGNNAEDLGLRVWDVRTGRTVAVLSGKSVLTPAGDQLLTGFPMIPFDPESQPDVPTLYLAEVVSSQHVRDITFGVDGLPYNAVFSPDGQLVAVAAYDISVRRTEYTIFTWPDLEPISRFGVNGYDSNPSFSADGTRLATGEDEMDGDFANHSARVWDIATGQLIDRNEQRGPVLFALDVDAENRVLAGGAIDSMIHLMAYNEQRSDQVWALHDGIVSAGVLSPDQTRLLTGNNLGTIILSNPVRQEAIRTFNFRDSEIRSLAFAPDGLRAAAGDRWGQIVIWNLETGDLLHVVESSGLPLVRLEFTSDGKYLISSSLNAETRIWRLPPYTSIDEMMNWLQNNRYIPEFTCDQRERFNIAPQCSTPDQVVVSRTPVSTLTPSLTPTITLTPNLTETTGTPTNTPTITPTPIPTIPNSTPTVQVINSTRREATLGRTLVGNIVPNAIHIWTFTATAGQTLSLNLNGSGISFSLQGVDGEPLLMAEDVLFTSLQLAADGEYQIVLEPTSQTAPVYTLKIDLTE